MGISPFKRGDFVRVKPEFFERDQFDRALSPLSHNEVGIVTAVSAQGDKRPRYLKLNGKSTLYHYSMFEGASPTRVKRLTLSLSCYLIWR